MPAIILAGLNHRTAQIDVRERLSFDACSLPMVVDDLHRACAGSGDLQEVVILSTCNRLEIYATSDDPEAGWATIRRLLAQQGDITTAELDRLIYLRRDRDAIQHLMCVAAGLDSLILGEPQILGQVAAAHASAQVTGGSGPILSHLFNQALHCGKRARTETLIGSYTTSISHAAVRLAEHELGDLSERSALVIGAGEMAELAATALRQHGVGTIFCVNRTQARAERLAMTVGGRALDWTRLAEALAAADIVISATSAPHVVLTADDIARAQTQRGGEALLLFDIALPRDIDVAVAENPGATLFDIDDLRDTVDANRMRREEAVPQVEAIVAEETGALIEWLSGREVLPALVELRRQAHTVASLELERTLRRLTNLERSPTPVDAERLEREVSTMAQRIVAKLLHEPTVRLKAQAANGNGAAYAHMLAELFDLSETNGAGPNHRNGAIPND